MALDPKVEELLITWSTTLDEQYKAGVAIIDAIPPSMTITKNVMRKSYDVKHELSALLTSTVVKGDTYALRYRIMVATKAVAPFDPTSIKAWEIGLAHLLSSDIKTFS